MECNAIMRYEAVMNGYELFLRYIFYVTFDL